MKTSASPTLSVTTSTLNSSGHGGCRALPPAESGLFLNFSYVLSRACLGKMFVLTYKWLQRGKRRFSHREEGKECEHARVGEPIRQCEKRGRHEGRSCITQTSRSHAPQVSRSHARASIRPNYDRITTEFVEDAPRRFATVAIDIALARTALENTCKKTRLPL